MKCLHDDPNFSLLFLSASYDHRSGSVILAALPVLLKFEQFFQQSFPSMLRDFTKHKQFLALRSTCLMTFEAACNPKLHLKAARKLMLRW